MKKKRTRRKTFLPSSRILQVTSATETYQKKAKTYGVEEIRQEIRKRTELSTENKVY